MTVPVCIEWSYQDQTFGLEVENQNVTLVTPSEHKIMLTLDQWSAVAEVIQTYVIGVSGRGTRTKGVAPKAPGAPFYGRPWPAADDKKLSDLYSGGMTSAELAEIFERSVGAIKARLERLGLVDNRRDVR